MDTTDLAHYALNSQHLQHLPGISRTPSSQESVRALGWVNPLDTVRIARERELLKPVDMNTFFALDEDEAVEFIVARREAAINEASRLAADEVDKELQTLFQTHLLKDHESLSAQLAKGGLPAASFNTALHRVADHEFQRGCDARRESLELLNTYLVKKQTIANQKAKLDQTFNEIVKREVTDLAAARSAGDRGGHGGLPETQASRTARRREDLRRPRSQGADRRRLPQGRRGRAPNPRPPRQGGGRNPEAEHRRG